MAKMKSLLTATVLAVIAVSAAHAGPGRERGEARLAQITQGRIAEKPVNCIDLRRISSTEIVDRTAIVYRVGRRLYVNRPKSGASILRRDDVLLTKSFTSQLCDVDSVDLLDHGSQIPRGFVGLGQFVPYVKPAAAK